jgi:uncharacterized protein with PQ loop repeat
MQNEHDPFANEAPQRPVVQLWMLFVSMVVFAFMSLLIMFAARVPAIANSISDLLGVARTVKSDRPDRSTHLFMLLFCYTSPLLLMLWVGMLRSILIVWFPKSNARAIDEPDSPFSNESNP